MKPSDFTKFPYDSIIQNSEHEEIARNIMVILKRTGDTFRELSWEEYKTERKNDGGFTNSEKPFFDRVKKYCISEETVKSFSPTWR